MVRSLPCEGATVLLPQVQRWSWLKRWGVQVAQGRGARRAQVAGAPALAAILRRTRVDGPESCARREEIGSLALA